MHYLLLYAALLAGLFALARRWPWPVRALAAAAVVAGAGLLAWSAAEGVWTDRDGPHFGSATGVLLFRVGLPLASVGAAVLLVGLLPDLRRWPTEAVKGAVANV